MPEQIIIKRCSKCNVLKSTGAFHKNQSRNDGLCHYCKECTSKRMKSYCLHYHTTESYRLCKKRYYESLKGRKYLKEARQIYMRRYPERLQARLAISHAIRDDKLPKPNTFQCSCGKPAEQYHHLDYTSKKGLNVVPKCRGCHKSIHNK